MLIKEYRVVLPISVSEYQVAQLWAVAQASKDESGGGEGIEVQKNEPYVKKDESGQHVESGQYTRKFYRFRSRVPKLFAAVAPAGSLDFLEEAWNAYPKCKTVFTNPDYMKEGFEVKIETIHKPDLGESDNVHNLPIEQWNEVKAKKGVIHIDIAAPVKRGDYNAETDPTTFKSQKCDRGLLKEGWIDELKAKAEMTKCDSEPQYMCAYKLVSCTFKWRGLQNRVESFIHGQEIRLFTNFHRQLFCWMDNWYGLNMDDIRRIEDETQKKLDELRNSGKLRGMAVDKF